MRSMGRTAKPGPRHAVLHGAGRHQVVDMLRGGAVALMIAYHFCFDLAFFGLLRTDMYRDPFWVGARSLIVTLFLLTVGVSLYLATRDGVQWRRFWRREALIAAAALAVSAGSYLVFPRSWIFFGVLHFIAVASLLGLAFRRLGRANLTLGAALVLLGITVGHPFFDQPTWQWFGLMTHKPVTEDYVPLLPWFGVVLLGLGLGQWLYGRKDAPAWARRESARPAVRMLAFAGRHSLFIYLVHQPLLLGLLWLVAG
jgi:uncharacterized membrane protein